MILISNKLIFLVMLLSPILALLIFHPNKIIKKTSKFSIIISLICVTFISPIIILINLKYWALLIILLPIIFRGLGVVLNKIPIPDVAFKLNKDVIIQLLIVSVGILALILLTIDYDMWSGLWLSLAILIFSGTIIMPQIDKFKLLYGVVFGALSFFMTPILKNNNGLATYFISWLICVVPFYYVPIVKRFIKYEVIPFIALSITSVILMKNGGISFIWNKFFSALFLMIVIHIMIACINYILENIKKSTVAFPIKQYYLPIILIIIEFILIYYKNEFSNFNYIISIPIMILSLEILIIYLGRIMIPLMYKLQNKHTFIKVNDIYDIFTLIFGKKIGQFLYKIIVGEYYNKLTFHEICIGTTISIITPLCSALLVYRNITINDFISGVFSLIPIYNTLAITFMIICGITVLDSIIKLFNNNRYSVGLKENDAINLSSTISVNYFFLFIYYLYIFLPSIDKINIYIKLFILIWLFAVSLSICISLSIDLSKPKYNTLKHTRHYASIFLYGNSIFIIIYSTLTDSLQISTSNSLINIFMKYYYIIIVCTFLCKLVGFDTSIASKKMRTKHIKDCVILTFLLGFSGIPLLIFGGIVLKISHSITLAKFITNLMYLSFMIEFTKSFIIAIMPSKNNIDQSLTKYIRFNPIK
ncbi:hypothetical protein [Clostridium weizhouense]|uniref:Uncharacterized protein n=1 Tax=Clostridium weizhouense TaxID=2859781 RepID=A0ABS7ARN4_9CLOT|nr:hypothetical protein [Clostridium weizhouense]MBW6411325.1 hypothetical protein [Clostridium weizhouense]